MPPVKKKMVMNKVVRKSTQQQSFEASISTPWVTEISSLNATSMSGLLADKTWEQFQRF